MGKNYEVYVLPLGSPHLTRAINLTFISYTGYVKKKDIHSPMAQGRTFN